MEKDLQQIDFRHPVSIIGMGMSAKDLTKAHHRLIDQADLLVGGRRHLSEFKDHVPETIEVAGDLKELVHRIRSEGKIKRIVVLASGDPLFFGIGAYLTRTLGKYNVRIFPNITSVAAAFARIGEPWQDVKVVSLHGRDQVVQLKRDIRSYDRIAVFTDPSHSPQWIGQFLRKDRFQSVEIGVFERMGSTDERISWHTPVTIEGKHFADPNMVILKQETKRQRNLPDLYLGMPESAFDHERGLITKAEVRAVSLAKLSLGPRQVLWDLGAGSGAVSIEASLLMPGGKIWAVDKNPDRVEQIHANRERFGVADLEVVEAVLPDGLDQLPDPDRVFIGGGGRSIVDILGIVCQRLADKGVLVINTVLMDSLHVALECLRSRGFATGVNQVQISRSKPLAQSDHMQAMNPVWIIRGERS